MLIRKQAGQGRLGPVNEKAFPLIGMLHLPPNQALFEPWPIRRGLAAPDVGDEAAALGLGAEEAIDFVEGPVAPRDVEGETMGGRSSEGM